MKKFLLVGSFFVIVAAAALVVASQRSRVGPLPVDKISPVAGPNKFGDTKRGVVFTYSGPAIELPTSLPTYTMTYPVNLSEKTAALARQWGFSSSLSQPVPYVFDWIDNDKHLSYNDQSKNISFSIFSSDGQGQQLKLSPQDVFSSLLSSQFLSDDFSFVETNRQTVRPGEGGGNKTLPPLTIITYQSKIKDRAFPFFFSPVTRTAGEIRTNPSGQVVSFSFYATAKINPEQERQVLNLGQIIDELNKEKGYLTGLSDDATGYVSGQPPSFTEVEITTIAPAFLFMPEESRFVPVFVAEGNGRGQSVQRVRYFLRASS